MVEFGVFALFVCAGTITFCQPNLTASLCSGKANPVAAFQPGTDFGKLPENWRMTEVSKPLLFTKTTAGAPRICVNAPIDLEMLFEPPNSRTGLQLPDPIFEQSDYPSHYASPKPSPYAKSELIPIQWPNLKFQPIPTQWPNAKLLLIDNDAAVTAQHSDR